jgi:hypothetical protein
MVLRDYENVRRSYQTLLDKRQEAKIAESLERRQKAEIFRVLDPANFPERPYQPDRALLILMGIAGGLAAGIGLAVFREQLDASIKTEADLVEASTGIPMLAVVPFVAPRAGKNRCGPSQRRRRRSNAADERSEISPPTTGPGLRESEIAPRRLVPVHRWNA